MERITTNQHCSSGVPVTVPSRLPAIPAALDECFPRLPDVQNQTTFAPLHGQFHSNTGSVGPLSSSPAVRFSSVSNPEQYASANPYASQAPSTGSSSTLNYGSQYGGLEPSFTNFPRDVGPTWCPDPVESMLGYSDDVPGGNNLTESSSIAATDELAKQTEWWTDFMNYDWKDDVGNTAGTETQSQDVYGLSLMKLFLEVACKPKSFCTLPGLTSPYCSIEFESEVLNWAYRHGDV